ncbi:MAG: LacI family DNA-binding transcriptional regulator [Verrucomicrobiota bacterium]
MVTLKQMAAQLDLSAQAVSAALAGKSGTSKVSPETVKRVEELAKKLNYRPHFSGKAMKSRKLGQIGFILPSYKLGSGSSGAFPLVPFLTLLGLNEVIVSQDLQIQIIQDDGIRSADQKLPRYLREQSVDAVILSGSSQERDRAIEEDLIRFSIPSVFLNSPRKKNSIYADDLRGATLATKHLLDLGHRRIHFVGSGSPHYSHEKRLQAYSETMKKAGETPTVHCLSLHVPQIKEYAKREELYKKEVHEFVTRVMKEKPPTALVCYDDTLALLVSSALQAAGYRIPEDISIVGYNDFPYVSYLHPAMTSIRLDFDQMGRAAGQMILDVLSAPGTEIAFQTIAPELIVRNSTAPYHPQKLKKR